MSRNLVWLAGRGVSMSCGLCWDVPQALDQAFRAGRITRSELTDRICEELGCAERDAAVDLRPLRALLERLRAAQGWRHAFVTTNWDGLLERALREHGFERPLHLNGSIAERNILTEPDSDEAREAVPQAREGLRRLVEADLCVVVGLSLSNRLDKGLVRRLAAKRGGCWLVVNHSAPEVRRTCEELRRQLPAAAVSAVELPFEAWVQAGMPGLGEALVREATQH